MRDRSTAERVPPIEPPPAQRWAHLSASIMCADFRRLPGQLRSLTRAGVRCAHLDFGDGHFVPNLPLGLEIFSQLPPRTSWVRECHLMIEEPLRLIPLFAHNADVVIFHVEASRDPGACIAAIRRTGAGVGIAVKPSTSPETIRPYLGDVDQVLIMSVEPGFAGGAFIPAVIEKVGQIRALSDRVNRDLPIEVDGAISASTIPGLADAGADRFVGGTSGLFLGDGLEESARALIACIEEAIGRAAAGRSRRQEPGG